MADHFSLYDALRYAGNHLTGVLVCDGAVYYALKRRSDDIGIVYLLDRSKRSIERGAAAIEEVGAPGIRADEYIEVLEMRPGGNLGSTTRMSLDKLYVLDAVALEDSGAKAPPAASTARALMDADLLDAYDSASFAARELRGIPSAPKSSPLATNSDHSPTTEPKTSLISTFAIAFALLILVVSVILIFTESFSPAPKSPLFQRFLDLRSSFSAELEVSADSVLAIAAALDSFENRVSPYPLSLLLLDQVDQVPRGSHHSLSLPRGMAVARAIGQAYSPACVLELSETDRAETVMALVSKCPMSPCHVAGGCHVATIIVPPRVTQTLFTTTDALGDFFVEALDDTAARLSDGRRHLSSLEVVVVMVAEGQVKKEWKWHERFRQRIRREIEIEYEDGK